MISQYLDFTGTMYSHDLAWEIVQSLTPMERMAVRLPPGSLEQEQKDPSRRHHSSSIVRHKMYSDDWKRTPNRNVANLRKVVMDVQPAVPHLVRE